MRREQLVRDAKRAALARMEDAARTTEDFQTEVKPWNHLDQNRERRERNHEVCRPNAEMLHWDKVNESDIKGKLRYGLDVVIPHPLAHPWWRLLMRGDFIDTIYDSAGEMWQLVEDTDISGLLKSLSTKQKDILFLRAVRLCTGPKLPAIRTRLTASCWPPRSKPYGTGWLR